MRQELHTSKVDQKTTKNRELVSCQQRTKKEMKDEEEKFTAHLDTYQRPVFSPLYFD